MASMESMNEIKVENDKEIVSERHFIFMKSDQEDMPPTFSVQKSQSENCMDLLKVEPGSCSDTCRTSSHNENQVVAIKVEEGSAGEREEENSLPIPFTPMDPEYDNCMDFLKVKLGSFGETCLTSSHNENQVVGVKVEEGSVGEREENDPQPIPFTPMNPEYDMQHDEASPAKRPRLLPVNQVRENVMFSDSDEAENNTSDTEDEEVEPHSLSRGSPSSEPPSSLNYSTSTSEDEDTVGNVAGHQPQSTQWTLPPYPQVHTFTGAPKGKSSEAAHITRESTPLSVLMLFFAEIVSLLVVETNRYYHEYLVNNDEELSSQRDVTEGEMFVFLAVTLQMGHTIQGRLEDYWTKLEQLCCPFYGQTMVRARYHHILRFLHFRDNNRNRVDGTDDSDDKLWKIRNLFEILRTNFSNYYNPSEHLAVDEITVKFKGRTVFKPYILQKHKHYGIKLYKLCDSTGYTYDMDVYEYVDKDRQRTAQHLTATHTTMTNLTRRIEGDGYKLYMDSFFSSPDLFDDLAQKNIYCCGPVKLHRKGMPKDLKPKTLRLKRGDIRVRTRGDLTAVVWRDTRDMCFLTNMHDPPREGNYRDEHGNAIKPALVADYNRHMGYVDRADRMANSYTASRRTWKWTKKLFFHLLDLAVLNSYILLSSCGGKKISHRDFRLTLIREMLAWAGHEPQPSIGRPAPISSNIRRLDTRHGKHWPGRNSTKRRCRVCSARGVKRRTVIYKCVECDVALCVDRNCFADYHTKDIL